MTTNAHEHWQKHVWNKLKKLGYPLDCHYCSGGYCVDNMEVHLIVAHQETAKEARQTVDDMIGAIPLDDDMEPLADCTLHGLHRMDYGCDKCEEFDYKAEGKNEA